MVSPLYAAGLAGALGLAWLALTAVVAACLVAGSWAEEEERG